MSDKFLIIESESSQPAPKFGPTLVIFLVVLAALLFSWFSTPDGAGAKVSAPKPANTQAQQVAVVTDAKLNLATPTSRPTLQPTSTATTQPTRTPLPANTAIPTKDLGALATERAIGLDVLAEKAKIENTRNQNAVEFWREVSAIAWEFTKIRLVLMSMGLVFLFFGVTFYRAAKDTRPNPVHAPRNVQEAQDDDDEGDEVSAPFFALPAEKRDEWLDLIDWNHGGKMPPESESVYALFGNRDDYREFVHQLAMAGWAVKRGTAGWYVTHAFAREVGRQIMHIKPEMPE
jgi:hypothetical protein